MRPPPPLVALARIGAEGAMGSRLARSDKSIEPASGVVGAGARWAGDPPGLLSEALRSSTWLSIPPTRFCTHQWKEDKASQQMQKLKQERRAVAC